MNPITKDEFKILKAFMEIPEHTMNQSTFDKLYPSESIIRISAVRLINQLHYIEYPPILDENGNKIGYNPDELRITPDGRFAYKLYKDEVRKERKRFLLDKAIPFCALIISILALLKSYGYGIEELISWCTQLLKQ